MKRFLCRVAGRTVSLLPVFMAAGLMGTLAQVEATVAAVEQAGDGPMNWRKLHPARHYSGRARRWVERRVGGVLSLLKKLVTLYPDRCGQRMPTLTGFALLEHVALGNGELLGRLRRLAEKQLEVLPVPVGFRPLKSTDIAEFVASGALQHGRARSPPAGSGSGAAD